MAQPDAFIQRFLENLRALGIADEARVLVALSGGADSVTLLHLLRFSSPDAGRAIFVAHYDHAMRPESARDAAWVAGLCRAWGVPLVSGRAEGGLRTEEEARDARYAFLGQAREEVRAEWIATAHHAGDQAETVLFRVLRGTGIAGLAGIPAVDAARGLVRPLLPFTRAQLRQYAGKHGLRWREDASNAGLDPVRNRIRNQILPLIEQTVAPGARAALARLARTAAEDEAAWNAVLAGEMEGLAREEDGALVLVRERLAGYDSTVAARLLRALLRRLGVVPDRDGTRSALRFIGTAPSGRELTLAGGIRIRTEFGEARIERSPLPVPPDAPLALNAPRGEGRCRIGGREHRVAWRPADGVAADGAESFAVAAEQWPLLVRGWLPGDRVRTHAGTRTLKRLFNDRRVPRSARARVPVLADARERVLWVAGVARGAPPPRPGEPGVTVEIHDA
ncbi:MAG TPA: tRNA lysidine(34) synthetase TilS [Longimicrobium sp.]|nr:tRNA lysidine(34) synthetase TilS [Longimicrobium sp.]